MWNAKDIRLFIINVVKVVRGSLRINIKRDKKSLWKKTQESKQYKQ